MKWTKTAQGGKLHAIVDGHTLCGVAFVHETESPNSFDERCANCDARWRRAGRAQKPRKTTKGRPNPKTIYREEHTFADWEKES